MELVQRLNSFPWNVFRVIFDVDEEAIHVILKALVKSWLGCGSMGFAFGGGTGFQDKVANVSSIPSSKYEATV
jgi:hypothetical protein